MTVFSSSALLQRTKSKQTRGKEKSEKLACPLFQIFSSCHPATLRIFLTRTQKTLGQIILGLLHWGPSHPQGGSHWPLHPPQPCCQVRSRAKLASGAEKGALGWLRDKLRTHGAFLSETNLNLPRELGNAAGRTSTERKPTNSRSSQLPLFLMLQTGKGRRVWQRPEHANTCH